ncbi:MAG: hypothetical protein WD425_17665 [Nitrospirales bacterium]
MAKSLDLIDERVIAEAVVQSVARSPSVEVPVDNETDLSTVGPGWRVWGVGVHRVAGALNIEVELIVTLNKKSSIPSISTRVRRMIRTGIQSLTSEQIRWINLRISDVRFKD